jgi:hypothetical protein
LKKAAISLVALVFLAASALPASAAEVTSLAVSGSNPRPQVAAPVMLDVVVRAALEYLGF